jgi:hypothetical protein
MVKLEIFAWQKTESFCMALTPFLIDKLFKYWIKYILHGGGKKCIHIS